MKVLLAVFLCSAGFGLVLVRHDPPTANSLVHDRSVPLAARAVRLEARPTAPAGEDEDGVELFLCDERSVSRDGYCAPLCVADDECAPGERCQVLDVPTGPGVDPVFAADDADRILETEALIEVTATQDLVDVDPVCEGDCAPYSGNLTIHAAPVLALCVVVD